MTTLSARSVVASTLLGTVPPRLPGHLLVAFAAEFGVNPGTTRVALSRMVERGELVREDDGVYALSGTLLERQSRQDAGLTPRTRQWTGEWEMYVVRTGGRESTQRAALRRAASHLGLREHRDGVWLRPDNLEPTRVPTARAVIDDQADRFLATPAGDEASVELAAELFDLESWAATAARLEQELVRVGRMFAAESEAPLAAGFELAAEVLRHLVADPLLPDPLVPPGWPAAALRAEYERYDRAYRRQLSAFFRSRSRLAG